MKKVLSIIAMATLAVLFCGCNKENAPATGSMSVTISATMPDDEITKTELNGTALTWKETDKIHLKGLDNAQTWVGADAHTSPRAIKPGGKIADFFATFSPDDWQDVKVVVGYYGISENRKDYTENDYRDGGWYAANAREDSGGTVSSFLFYTNPCVQEYYDVNGPNGDYLAMADMDAKDFRTGEGEKMQFQFENLMSIIKIPVSSRSARILETIKVVGDGSPLSGVFYGWKIPAGGSPTPECWVFDAMTGNDNSCEPIAEDFSRGTYGNWVKLDKINVTLNESAQYFYLVVFPGNPGSLEFTLTDTEGNIKVVAWNNPIRLGSGKIYNFPEIVW